MHTKHNITRLLFPLFILFPLVATNVLAETSENVVEQPMEAPLIFAFFAGKPMECSTNIMLGSTKNCCQVITNLKGKIFTCSEEEMELAKLREMDRAVYIGEYCHNKVLGICTSYHQVYCVFDSPIAKIIQTEGRNKQLGINFGEVTDDEPHPNCRGITHDELLKINFDMMDCSEFCAEMSTKIYEGILQEEESKQKIYEYACEAALKEKQDVSCKSPGA